MGRLVALTIWLALCVEGSVAAGLNVPDVHKLQAADPYHLVPVMANNPGQFGAYFKTRVSILNPTSFAYPIYVNLYGPGGKVGTKTSVILPHEAKNYENFLQEVFTYSGAGSVEFDSWFDPPGGSPDYQFLVSAEVYTDSSNGQYKTVVTTGAGGFAARCAERLGLSAWPISRIWATPNSSGHSPDMKVWRSGKSETFRTSGGRAARYVTVFMKLST